MSGLGFIDYFKNNFTIGQDFFCVPYYEGDRTAAIKGMDTNIKKKLTLLPKIIDHSSSISKENPYGAQPSPLENLYAVQNLTHSIPFSLGYWTSFALFILGNSLANTVLIDLSFAGMAITVIYLGYKLWQRRGLEYKIAQLFSQSLPTICITHLFTKGYKTYDIEASQRQEIVQSFFTDYKKNAPSISLPNLFSKTITNTLEGTEGRTAYHLSLLAVNDLSVWSEEMIMDNLDLLTKFLSYKNANFTTSLSDRVIARIATFSEANKSTLLCRVCQNSFARSHLQGAYANDLVRNKKLIDPAIYHNLKSTDCPSFLFERLKSYYFNENLLNEFMKMILSEQRKFFLTEFGKFIRDRDSSSLFSSGRYLVMALIENTDAFQDILTYDYKNVFFAILIHILYSTISPSEKINFKIVSGKLITSILFNESLYKAEDSQVYELFFHALSYQNYFFYEEALVKMLDRLNSFADVACKKRILKIVQELRSKYDQNNFVKSRIDFFLHPELLQRKNAFFAEVPDSEKDYKKFWEGIELPQNSQPQTHSIGSILQQEWLRTVTGFDEKIVKIFYSDYCQTSIPSPKKVLSIKQTNPTSDDIKKGYRAMMKKYHPDRIAQQEDVSEEIWNDEELKKQPAQLIQQAMENLCDRLRIPYVN